MTLLLMLAVWSSVGVGLRGTTLVVSSEPFLLLAILLFVFTIALLLLLLAV